MMMHNHIIKGSMLNYTSTLTRITISKLWKNNHFEICLVGQRATCRTFQLNQSPLGFNLENGARIARRMEAFDVRSNMHIFFVLQSARQPRVRFPRMAGAFYSCCVLFVTVTAFHSVPLCVNRIVCRDGRMNNL